MDEAWRRFESALRPLHDAEKLGAVLFQYPPWFGPRKDNRAEIEALRERLPDYRVSVEFRSPRWTGRRARPRADAEDARGARSRVRVRRCAGGVRVATRDGGDEPGSVPDALPRALGQHLEGHLGLGGRAVSIPVLRRRSWRSWQGRSPSTPREARETHLLMNNCYRDYAVLGRGPAARHPRRLRGLSRLSAAASRPPATLLRSCDLQSIASRQRRSRSGRVPRSADVHCPQAAGAARGASPRRRGASQSP